MLLAEVVVMGVGFGAVAALGGFEAFAADPMAALRRIGGPWLIARLLVWSLLVTVIYEVWMAAWADIYRQLRPANLAETFA